MVEVIPDVNLSFKEYQASLSQLPSNIFYQRIDSRNVSNTNCSFTVSSPNKRSYLLAGAQIEWQFTFLRTDTDGATFVPNTALPLPYIENRDLISLKPHPLPVANAMSSITTSINGSTSTIAQPRRFMEAVSMMHVSREECNRHYEVGYPDAMGGRMSRNFPAFIWGYIENDKTMVDNYYDFANRQLRDKTATGTQKLRFNAGVANVDAGGTIIVTEPVISPPFDCYSKVSKADMPDWSPWKWMSPVIPNIDRLEIDIQFTKLDASMMYYHYGKSVNAANTRPPAMTIPSDGVKASLLLYWAETPVSVSIPRSIDLQTWNVREFQDAVTNAPIDNAVGDAQSSLIQLNSVPSLILTHLEVDKDNIQYQPVALTSGRRADDVEPQTEVRVGGAINNWDSWGEISTITYLLGELLPLWYLIVLLTYLVQGTPLELQLPLIYRNIYNRDWENQSSWS